jgi:hypothetical protein
MNCVASGWGVLGQAEGVPGRVGEDAPPAAARLGFWLCRAQLQDEGLGVVQVVDREVEVKLLWRALARPTASSLPVSCGSVTGGRVRDIAG